MIHVDLTEQDAAILVKALDYYVSELRMEVTDTEQQDMRETLKAEERTLRKVSQALKTKLGMT